jgi:hypothetical protein
MITYRQLEQESLQLEIENRKMEERLKELKESMQRQKEIRGNQGHSWRSGSGSTSIKHHANEVLQGNSARRAKAKNIRVLTVCLLLLLLL